MISRRKITIKSATLLLFLLFSNALAFGWGCVGHQTVALVALSQLNATASARVHKLLQGQPQPTIHRFCGATTLDILADVATWADDEREVRKNTAEWHFVDIPLNASRDSIDTFCDPNAGCVTQAINTQLATLRSGKGTQQDQANALMFLVHFMGDLHQPLHDTTNNDRGANCIPIIFFGQQPKLTDASGEGYTPNLHGVWDTDLPTKIGNIRQVSRDDDVKQFAAELSREFASDIKTWQHQPLDLDEWAWDSHQLAVSVAYGKLSTPVNAEKPQTVNTCFDDNNVGNRMKALNEEIGTQYLASVTAVIKEQLAKAGTRLAMVLNQLWP
jgi:hypothetical protein